MNTIGSPNRAQTTIYERLLDSALVNHPITNMSAAGLTQAAPSEVEK